MAAGDYKLQSLTPSIGMDSVKLIVDYCFGCSSSDMKRAFHVLVFAVLGAGQWASAATIGTFADAAAFRATLQSGASLESFAAVPYGDLKSPTLSLSSGAYSFQFIAGTGNLAVYNEALIPSSKYLTTLDLTSLKIVFDGGAPTAVGGFLFGSTFEDEYLPASFTVDLSDGSSFPVVSADLATTPYLGFWTDSTDPFEWLTISTNTIGAYVSLDNVSAGQAVIPEPSTFALGAGVLALGFAIWRRRS